MLEFRAAQHRLFHVSKMQHCAASSLSHRASSTDLSGQNMTIMLTQAAATKSLEGIALAPIKMGAGLGSAEVMRSEQTKSAPKGASL